MLQHQLEEVSSHLQSVIPIESNSCSPKKYHGAFAGFGVIFGFASSNKGACKNCTYKNQKRVIAINEINSGNIK